MLARHFPRQFEYVSDRLAVVVGLRELDMLRRRTRSLQNLFSCTDKDIEMTDTEEVHHCKDENNVCINILSLSEPVLVVEERAEDRTDELAQPRACHEYSADVVV